MTLNILLKNNIDKTFQDKEKTLDLSNNNTNLDTIEYIIKQLRANPDLIETLNLHNTSLGAKALEALGGALENKSNEKDKSLNIKFLDISNNGLNEKTLLEFTKALGKNHSLVKINVKNNDIKSDNDIEFMDCLEWMDNPSKMKNDYKAIDKGELVSRVVNEIIERNNELKSEQNTNLSSNENNRVYSGTQSEDPDKDLTGDNIDIHTNYSDIV